MSYLNVVRKHRRLSILRHLEGCTGYSSNASILQDVLNGLGVTTTRDQVVTEITWLKDQGLADVEDHGDFVVVTATVSGVEIARGITTHPEIKRPSPGH